jgi:DNA-binding response OmpR family regulator
MKEECPCIFIVDDDPQVNEFLVWLFARKGFEVASAQALDFISKGRFDVILLDLVMPGMGGYAVIAEVRKAGVKLPIVVHSSHVGCLDVERLKAMGATEVLLKPANPEELVATVRRVVEANTVEHPSFPADRVALGTTCEASRLVRQAQRSNS